MEALGVDLKLLIAQIVNFLIVMLVLWKFAYNPILNMFNERKEKIEKGLSDSEEAGVRLKKAETEAEKVMEKAYSDANEILKNAKAAATAEGTELIAKPALRLIGL